MPDNYSQSPLVKKLVVKPKMRMIALTPPEGYRELLGDLPEGATYTDVFDGTFDWIHVFVKTKAELESRLSEIKARLQPGSVLCISFPRAKNATDLNRNSLLELPERFGLQPVSNAVVNDEWTAYRIKLVEEK